MVGTEMWTDSISWISHFINNDILEKLTHNIYIILQQKNIKEYNRIVPRNV